MTEVIARQGELRVVHDFLERRRGNAAALVLEGEAGIGKTTLFRAALGFAADRQVRVLCALPARAEQQLAYAGLGDLLEPVLAEALPELSSPRRRALEIALLRAEPDGPAPEPRAVGVAVRSTLAVLAGKVPLVLAIDDEQWLDASSAALLEFALRRLLDAPIALVLARRAGIAGPRLERSLPDDRVELVPVKPLSMGAIHTLVRQRLGHSLARPALIRIHETSGGNPFFALELAHAFEDSPLGKSPPLPVPETLEAAVRDRLGVLPKRSRPVLLACAADGTPQVELLERGWPGASRGLDAAERAGALRVANGDVRFVHPLFASVVYEQATSLERRRAHARLAELVDDPIERARHCALAHEGADAEIARMLEGAADHARRRGAPIAAAELGELALQRTPVDEADDRRHRALQVARDHLAAGDMKRARAFADELVASAATDRASAEALFLESEIERVGGTREQVVRCLYETLAAAKGVAPEIEADVHAWLALHLRFTDTTVAEAHARRGVALAARLDDDGISARALAALALIRFQAGHADAFELAERALGLTRGSRDQEAIYIALGVCAHGYLWSGELDRAREHLTEQYNAVVGRDLGQEAGCLWFFALLEWRAGNWPLAQEWAERCRELLVMVGPEAETEVLFPLATIVAHRGDEAAARKLAGDGLQAMAAQGQTLLAGGFHGIIGQLDLWSGHPASAVERFVQAAETGAAVGRREPAQARYNADHVEALVELGRLDDALVVLEPWEAAAVRLDRTWALAETTRCRGLLAAARGEAEQAAALLAEAADRHEAAGDPFGRARALYALGRTRRSAGERRAARAVFGAALEAFEALGAARWIERTRGEIGQIGGREREDGLTASELRVAELVAGGRTNREVAAALFLSEKTVEGHLSRIYGKLGIRSRTELARELR